MPGGGGTVRFPPTAMDTDILAYGAALDGASDSTAAIQAAIDACAAAGGGRVSIPPGLFRTYTLHLKSHVELHLEAGAVLKGGDDPLGYPLFEPNAVWRVDRAPRLNRRALLYTLDQDDVAITGKGTIDGNAPRFHSFDPARGRIWRNSDTEITGRCVFFAGCRDVRLEDVTIRNPSGWSTWFLACDRVTVRGVRILCPPEFPNADGIHLSASADVVVSDCVVHSQDDAFVFRSHQEQLFAPRPLERVVISNCVCSTCCACFRFGWSGDWLVRDVSIDNVVCSTSWVGLAIVLPPLDPDHYLDPPRAPDLPLLPEEFRKPFELRRVRISNWSCVSTAESLQLAFGNARRTEPVAAVRDIALAHCRLEGRGHPVFVVRPENNVGGLRFDDVSFAVRPATPPKTVPADSVWFDNCDDVSFDRCRWSVIPESSAPR